MWNRSSPTNRGEHRAHPRAVVCPMTRVIVPALVLACGPLLLGAPQSDRKTAETKWTLSRTPDGHPDLEGIWTNYDSTPFERLGPASSSPGTWR
jgi:hypothetical protein